MFVPSAAMINTSLVPAGTMGTSTTHTSRKQMSSGKTLSGLSGILLSGAKFLCSIKLLDCKYGYWAYKDGGVKEQSGGILLLTEGAQLGGEESRWMPSPPH